MTVREKVVPVVVNTGSYGVKSIQVAPEGSLTSCESTAPSWLRVVNLALFVSGEDAAAALAGEPNGPNTAATPGCQRSDDALVASLHVDSYHKAQSRSFNGAQRRVWVIITSFLHVSLSLIAILFAPCPHSLLDFLSLLTSDAPFFIPHQPKFNSSGQILVRLHLKRVHQLVRLLAPMSNVSPTPSAFSPWPPRRKIKSISIKEEEGEKFEGNTTGRSKPRHFTTRVGAQDDGDKSTCLPTKAYEGGATTETDTALQRDDHEKDDTWSQSLSGSTFVGAWHRGDEQWDAASVTDVGPYEAAREEFASLIKNEKRLENVRDDIEKLLQPETFEESFRNMLNDFAVQLRAEASHPEERDAARAASINRAYIANCVSEMIFKMAEFTSTHRVRDLLESRLLRYSRKKGGRDNDVQVFEGDENDELDNELEGPINLLKMEAFIESSKAWSKLFGNLESWVRDAKKAKKIEEKRKRQINTNKKSLSENGDNGSSDTSPLATERSTKFNRAVSAFQVALLWAWTMKLLVQLYGKSSGVMQAVVGYISIIPPMYAMILLPREPVFRDYILCLFIPNAYMVYASAVGFTILASRSCLPMPLASFFNEEETPHTRVKWKCTCGDKFHEDFAEPRERDAIALFEYLFWTGNRPRLEISSRDGISATRVFGEGLPGIAVSTTSHANSSINNSQQQPSATDTSDSVNETDNEYPVNSSAHNSVVQNITSGQPENATGTAKFSNMVDSGDQRDQWFLLCYDQYENAGKALNIRVPDSLDDLSLIRHLRRHYVASRGGFGRHFKWRKIRNFNFVRFQAHLDPLAQEELVFKDKEWDVPPDYCDSNWSPWPLKERPPVVVEKMLSHYWNYPHDSMSFRFSNACKHLARNIWQNCQSGCTGLLSFLSHRPAPSSIWMAMCKASSRFYTSARSLFEKTWSSYKLNKTNTLPQSNHDINFWPQPPQDNDQQQQQHSGTSSAPPPTRSHQGTNSSAVTQPIPQQRLPHLISSVYPRRLHTELHPNPTCYGWGLYLGEVFEVPTSLRALLLTLQYAVLISTLTVALVDFHRGDRYDVFSLPNLAVAVFSLVAANLRFYRDSGS